jgi:DUF4097 and DUF4098 domain-containing protein YvlB
MASNQQTERMEILKMLSEGKISVDEAERLLKALDSSYGESSESRGSQRRSQHRHGGEDWWSSFFDVEDFVSNIDSKVKNIFSDLKDKDLFPDFLNIFDVEEGERPENHRVVIEPNTVVTINMLGRSKNWWHKFQGGDITITRGEDSTVQLNPDETPSIIQRGNHCLIMAETKHLQLELPNHIKSLNCFSAGGEINVEGLDCPVKCKTLGGDIHLDQVKFPIDLKTMGGNIEVKEWTANDGSSKLVSMGGNIETRLTKQSSAKFKVHSLGGRIHTNLERKEDNSPISMMIDSYEGKVGEGNADVRIESAGGTIKLEVEEGTQKAPEKTKVEGKKESKKKG